MNTECAAKSDRDEEARIGVFVCDCGTNIAGHVDCGGLTRYAASLDGVVYAKESLYSCSESGIAEIQQAISTHHLNRVVVASCSPRTHQPLFQASCAQAGLNPYLFEMANIRDQCSWVHMKESGHATQKAKDLVRMAVAKAFFLDPQKDIETPVVPRVLVIGGGVAGLSASQTLADLGLEVVLVEKEAEPGGLLKDIHRLALEDTSPRDLVSALFESLSLKKNVTAYLNSVVTGIKGYIGNFEITILNQKDKAFREKAGCIVVATGASPFKPEGMFGYNGKNVITQMELEKLLLNGESFGRRIVMIQCVGARTPKREYCSRICCATAVKNAVFIKERDPNTEIHVLYRDIQMYGTENERLLWEARRRGVRFDVYSEDKPPTVKDKTVRLYQPMMGERLEIPYDLVVLSTPLVGHEDSVALSQLLRVPIDRNRFFLEAHAKLRPLDFATDGIFLCGSARYPATVAEARIQGLGVASRVAAILSKDKLVTRAIVAEIDAEKCAGCQACMEMCPFEAICFVPEKMICEINTAICKGCGCCSATCPSQTVRLKGFTPQQISAQIRALYP